MSIGAKETQIFNVFSDLEREKTEIQSSVDKAFANRVEIDLTLVNKRSSEETFAGEANCGYSYSRLRAIFFKLWGDSSIVS